MTKSLTVDIKYKEEDGWHIYTSNQQPGLFVASLDAQTARNDAAHSLETLIFLNTGKRCKAELIQEGGIFYCKASLQET